MRKLLLWIAVCLCFLPLCARAESGVNRALLIGCDEFVSQQDTTPSAANNVSRMAQTLSGGAMNLENLVTRSTGLTSVQELEELVELAFSEAQEGDVSYFYIATHGVWEEGRRAAEMTLLLSDGQQEAGVTAYELREIFDRVPGVKVLILDACHAGAVIGKGVHAPFDNLFVGPDYKVICSSGGAEESWYWSGETEGGMLTGEGYFSGALSLGLSARGGYGADANRDGVITLTEVRRYLEDNHGASTARTYPEEDDFAVLRYDVESFTRRRRGSAVEGVSFTGDVLTADEPEIDFTFNMLRPAQVAYQLVYRRNGRWDFPRAQLIWDNAERFGVYGDALGYLTPGMKERSISLGEMDEDSWGYVLLQMLSIDDGAPSVAASRVICVPPVSGDPLLEVITAEAFYPDAGEEFSFVIHHQYPCELSVTIEDTEGKTVRRLTSRRPTRPEQLLPLGTSLCWNGRLSDGTLAPVGEYRIRVKAYLGDEVYEAVSDVFLLVEGQG